ncbi:jerky protein homolog [Scylla paramamosain]|uniref:jerky protein homolog n=1 Tax=Scylla paramamosain TaxID=85552 RepID=UPI0030829F6C
MAGTHKVKLCMVGKHKKPRCFKNVNYLPVDYRNQRSAWMTAEIFLDWFKHCFVPSVKENLKKNGLPEDSKEWVDVDENQAITFTLTDEELINAVVDHLEKISDDSDDDDDDNEPKVTWEQVAKHIAGFVRNLDANKQGSVLRANP